MVEDGIKQRLSAVLAADAAGYARLMAVDERATLVALDRARAVFRRRIEAHGGRVIDMAGDSVLATFETAAGAVHAAVECQDEFAAAKADPPGRLRFRIGIHLGDLIQKDDGTVYGDGVNIAARLQVLADPGGLVISDTVHGSVPGALRNSFTFVGEHTVKNIPHPVRAFRLAATGMSAGTPDPAASADPGPDLPVAPASKYRRRVAISLAAFLTGLAGLGAWVAGTWDGDAIQTETRLVGEAAPPPDKPSIAVLPFNNLSGDAADRYFSDGITSDIVTELAKVSALFVISTNSSFAYRTSAGDGPETLRDTARFGMIAAALKARYLLEGSLRRAGDTIRLNVHLVDAASGRQLWAERFERTLTDIFAVQDEITGRVVQALKVAVTEVEKSRLGRRTPVDLEAYDLYLRARSVRGGATATENARARALLDQSIAREPNFAQAHAELSLVCLQSWYYQWTDDPDHAKACGLTAAETAISLEPDLAAAHTMLSWALVWHGEHERAVAEGRQAIDLDPNYADGYLYLSHVLVYAGLPDDGIAIARRGMPLDPSNRYHYLQHIGDAYWMKGESERALAYLRQSVADNPNWVGGYLWLAALYGELGRTQEAANAAAELRRLSPTFALSEERGRLPYKDPALAARIIAGLRKAGLGDPDEGA